MKSPRARPFPATKKTMEMLRDYGCLVGKTEHWQWRIRDERIGGREYKIADGGVRQDLFGFVDLVALHPIGVMAVQCFTSDWTGHLLTLRAETTVREAACAWFNSGGRILYVGWQKRMERNPDGSKRTYQSGPRKGETRYSVQPRMAFVTGRVILGQDEPDYFLKDELEKVLSNMPAKPLAEQLPF